MSNSGGQFDKPASVGPASGIAQHALSLSGNGNIDAYGATCSMTGITIYDPSEVMNEAHDDLHTTQRGVKRSSDRRCKDGACTMNTGDRTVNA